MTPKVERHIAAVVDRLRAVVPATRAVDVGVAPSAPPPYLVVHPDSGDVARDRLCGERDSLWLRFEVEAVGSGPEQALWALDQARAAVDGHRLVVADRTVSPIQQIDGSSLRRDEMLQPPIYMIDLEYRLFSQAG